LPRRSRKGAEHARALEEALEGNPEKEPAEARKAVVAADHDDAAANPFIEAE
jgi:hypothetical protein